MIKGASAAQEEQTQLYSSQVSRKLECEQEYKELNLLFSMHELYLGRHIHTQRLSLEPWIRETATSLVR